MIRRFICLSFVILAGLATRLGAGIYDNGTGEPNDPYLISSAENMNQIGMNPDDWDAHFLLTADINLADYTGTEFNIIGMPFDNPFTGVFDGNGHSISNFTYESSGISKIGLFGYINDVNAEIKDLTLIAPNLQAGTGDYVGPLVGFITEGTVMDCRIEDGSVSGNSYIGGLAGYNSNGTISNCYANGEVAGTANCIGGLAGENWSGEISNCSTGGNVEGTTFYPGGLVGLNAGTILNCHTTCNVTGDDRVGGLVAINISSGRISNCYATGNVEGTGYGIGGLVSTNNGTISNCYVTGDVWGHNGSGGLIGRVDSGEISNCYACGTVSGNSFLGGLVGFDYGGTYLSCFWDNTVNSGLSGFGFGSDPNVIGKSTGQMQTKGTFTSGGWDFVDEIINGLDDIWTINDGHTYPILTLQTAYSGGDGNDLNPYLISKEEDLHTLGADPNNWDKDFLLIADINLASYSGTKFNIIGTFNNRFTGVFDGNGHNISNFTYESDGLDKVGLFRYVDGVNAEIRDLILIDPNVDGGTDNYVGTLIAYLVDGTVTDCSVKGGSINGHDYVGSLVGHSEGTISRCYGITEVTGNSLIGGLVGVNGSLANQDSTISNCYAKGNVQGTLNVAGGLVGGNNGIISDCYAMGDVGGNHSTGGFAGDNIDGTIVNCYSIGEVVGTGNYSGGLVGIGAAGTYVSCFWNNTVNPGLDGVGSGPNPQVIGKSTNQMQTMSTFVFAGWDFMEVWDIAQNQTYPFLLGTHPRYDLDQSGSIDEADLAIFVDHWLQGVIP
ncbi:MAG: GLUG motif-containing protein [Planctomycetota bacterium]|jgi:hypothetical protein